jgi:hypothetical protein
MLTIEQKPIIAQLTWKVFNTPGSLCPNKRVFDPVAVPQPSSKGEDSILAFFLLPLFGFLFHEKSRLRREVLLPTPFLELVFIQLFAMEGQQISEPEDERIENLTMRQKNAYSS